MGSGRGRIWKKAQGIRSINGRYKIDRGMLRIVCEMEKPKNLFMTHRHELRLGNASWKGGGK